MIKKIGITILAIVLTTGFYFIFNQSITKEQAQHQYLATNIPTSEVLAPHIPEKLEFAGERVPIEFPDVYESLDNEMLANTFWHSQVIRFIKRSNKYFPVIEPILRKNNIPDDFKYLAVAESGLSNVVSPSKAAGFWQFLKGTAKDYRLEVNKDIDERYHLEKSTQAACDYLNDAYKKLGSWTLVAASYNMGMSGLANRLSEQKVNNYYDLRLNSETARYVFRIVAIKTIMEDPSKYGFKIRTEDMYQTWFCDTLLCDSSLSSLVDYAQMNGTSYKLLKLLNPWLISNTLNNSENKSYTIFVPQRGFRNFVAPKE
ncbi:MAG: lytic transglycosylase domain-containing protein [Bacteroidales bacterium]|nr:lytic transglycosylase domain-containing protein [Bacteroidales bacterium]